MTSSNSNSPAPANPSKTFRWKWWVAGIAILIVIVLIVRALWPSGSKPAVDAAKTVLDITNNQYGAGTASQLQVLEAQITALNNEGMLLGLQSRQYTSSVALILALGGGLDSSCYQIN